MAKYEAKTKPTGEPIESWLDKIEDEERRKDCQSLLKMMRKATGERPKMWGNMVGFGDCHYKYASGHEGDCFQMGFASRKPDLVLYVISGTERHEALLAKLGKHKLGKCCLYIRRLSNVNVPVLDKLITACARQIKKRAA